MMAPQPKPPFRRTLQIKLLNQKKDRRYRNKSGCVLAPASKVHVREIYDDGRTTDVQLRKLPPSVLPLFSLDVLFHGLHPRSHCSATHSSSPGPSVRPCRPKQRSDKKKLAIMSSPISYYLSSTEQKTINPSHFTCFGPDRSYGYSF
jgi:hypothetical protein